MAQFTQKLGPDPETTKILADNERHAEDNRLKAYQANLDKQDHQGQRDQEYRMAQLKSATRERYFVLLASLVALMAGALFTIKGNSSLGNPIMSAALTLLITLVSGKLRIGD
jgi:cation transport ATPase